MDTDRNPMYPLQSPANARYNCGRQGIQRGWADSYYNGLECQYIDVTDVPPGPLQAAGDASTPTGSSPS